jgi:hypothetical protein
MRTRKTNSKAEGAPCDSFRSERQKIFKGVWYDCPVYRDFARSVPSLFPFRSMSVLDPVAFCRKAVGPFRAPVLRGNAPAFPRAVLGYFKAVG